MDYYGTVAGYNSYMLERNIDAPITDGEELTAALLVASEWIDNSFRSIFPGTKVGQRAQVREWPRYSAYDAYGYYVSSEFVPLEIEQATYEAALMNLRSPGSLSPIFNPSKYKSVSIDGAISVDFNVFSSASDGASVNTRIGEILSGLLSASGASATGLTGTRSRI